MPVAVPPARPPIAALVVAGYGAVLGSLFPVVTIMTIADISGGLSVAADDGALVNTVQNVGALFGILIGPTVFAGLGRGRTMTIAGLGYLVSSLACAMAPDLGWMLVVRTIHGAFSGTMPLLFMMLIMSSLRPGAGQFEGMTAFATSTSLFLGVSASLGGALVMHFGWRSVFWVQALLAVPYVIASSRVLTSEKGDRSVLRSLDWASYLSLAVGGGMLLFAVAEGERHFWLEAWWVPALIVGGVTLVVSAILGTVRRADHPLLFLTVFERPTFAWAILLSLFYRFGLLFTIYIVPAFLGRVQGLRAEQVGGVLVTMAPATLLGVGAAYLAAHRVDSRLLLSAGLAMFAAAAWRCLDVDPSWAVDEFRGAAMLAGLGLGLFGVGVLRFSSFGAGPQDGPTVGMVFNLSRVIGNIGGLAILTHLVVEREKFHSAMITEALGATDPTTAQRLAASALAYAPATADPVGSQAGAFGALARTASTQAFTLAFADSMTIVTLALAAGAVFVWALPAIPKATATSPVTGSNT